MDDGGYVVPPLDSTFAKNERCDPQQQQQGEKEQSAGSNMYRHTVMLSKIYHLGFWMLFRFECEALLLVALQCKICEFYLKGHSISAMVGCG